MPSELKIPARSSGLLWTAEEDEQLYQAVLKIVHQFPGRSLAAIVTRIARNAALWSKECR